MSILVYHSIRCVCR